MLNQRERYAVLKFLYYCCKFAPFATEVNLPSWSLEESRGPRRCISFISYSNFCLHTLFKLVSLCYALLVFEQDIPLYQLILHVGLVVGYILTCFWYYTAYIGNFNVHKALVQIILKSINLNNGNGLSGNTSSKITMCRISLPLIQFVFPEQQYASRRQTYRILEYTLQDAITLLVPYTVILVFSGFVIYCSLDPSGMYLYYKFLPGSYKTGRFLLLCLVQDFHCLMYSVATVAPLLQLQVIGFDDICYRLSLVSKSLTRPSSNINGKRTSAVQIDFVSVRKLQVYVMLMNRVHCHLVFTYKLFSISFCVGTGYAAVAYFHENPALAIMCFLLCIDIVMIFSLVYAKGFQVQNSFGRVVKTMLKGLSSGDNCNVNGSLSLILKRQLKSVPVVGIKVGDFHMLERTSTPVFLDFVVRNIVGMLVLYH